MIPIIVILTDIQKSLQFLESTQETIYGLLQRQGEEIDSLTQEIAALNDTVSNISAPDMNNYYNTSVSDARFQPIFTSSSTCLEDYFLSAYFNSKVPTGTITIYSTCVGKFFCEWYSCSVMTGISMPLVTLLGDSFCGNGSCGAVLTLSLPSLRNIGNAFCKFASACGALTTMNYPNILTIGNFFCSNGGCPNVLTINFTNVTTIGIDFCRFSCVKATSLTLPTVTSIGNNLGGASSFTALLSLKIQKSMIKPLSMNLSGCPTLSTFTCSTGVPFVSISSDSNKISLVCSASVLQCA